VKYLLTYEGLHRLPGELVEEVKRIKGAWYREALGELAVRAGLVHLVERVKP
jgi:hypothetical protein